MSNQTLASLEPIVGGWSEFHKLTVEDLLVFNKALEGYVGVKYTPTKVAIQIVAGTNYRFRCTASVPPYDDAYESVVKIIKPLEGDPYVVKITRI